jgi:protein SCO1
MKPASTFVKYLGLITLLVGPVLFMVFFAKGDHKFIDLPYYGPKEPIFNEDGSVDTLFHKIHAFELTNQFGNTVSEKDFEGKILVIDFFFSTCPTICPKMTQNMASLQLKMNDKHFEKVHLLSYTVNPEYDTPEVLLKYAEKHEADPKKWTFLTGDQEHIYDLGVNSYLLPAQEDALAPGGFLHSEYIVLVDPNENLRGFYDGTDVNEMTRLLNDVKMLIKLFKEKDNNE